MPVDKKGRSPGYLREGYKKSVRTRFKVNPETGLTLPTTETEHFDGTQDARVVTRVIKIRPKINKE